MTGLGSFQGTKAAERSGIDGQAARSTKITITRDKMKTVHGSPSWIHNLINFQDLVSTQQSTSGHPFCPQSQLQGRQAIELSPGAKIIMLVRVLRDELTFSQVGKKMKAKTK